MSNELRNAFTVISVADLRDVAQQASSALINWNPADSQQNGFFSPSKVNPQSINALLNEKVTMHEALIRTLEATVSIEYQIRLFAHDLLARRMSSASA